MSVKVQVLDYGVGNLGSIMKMIRYLGHDAQIISNPEDILSASRLVLPGVGAFDRAMEMLNKKNLVEPLNEVAKIRQIPLLGICLGMQLLGSRSQEGQQEGLGLIPMTATRFAESDSAEKLKIPHMGWNRVFPTDNSQLLKDMHDEPRFYFVHSYYLKCDDERDIAAETQYGVRFVSAVERGNIFGAQFHPEKSHKFGMQFFRNFIEKV